MTVDFIHSDLNREIQEHLHHAEFAISDGNAHQANVQIAELDEKVNNAALIFQDTVQDKAQIADIRDHLLPNLRQCLRQLEISSSRIEPIDPHLDDDIQLAIEQERKDQLQLAESLRMPVAVPSLGADFSTIVLSRGAPAPIDRPKGVRNCWANSLLQMIANAPALAHAILQSPRDELRPVANLIRIYAEKQRYPGLVPAGVGQEFRKASPTTSNEFAQIEDPKDVLQRIIELLDPRYAFEQEFTMIAPNGSKITDRFSLMRNDELKGFEAVGCVIHDSEPGAEHFAALERKPDGWYLIDDNKIEFILEDKAKAMLQRAYLFHYQKIEASTPIPAATAPIIRVAESPIGWKMWLIAMTASSCRFLWNSFVEGISYLNTRTKK